MGPAMAAVEAGEMGPLGQTSRTALTFTDQTGLKRPNRASRGPQLPSETAYAVGQLGLTEYLSFFTRSSCIPHSDPYTQNRITTVLRAPRPKPVGT